ncbi:MAG: LytTR family DNA-binding domain-containing protein [Defluviitaleaceae bacterium]|nr:LytTR family DNA-binding domain-containing protein [Defluviitaleaceae bacterium]
MVYKIAVCDDSRNICSQVEEYVFSVCKSFNIKCDIDVFFDGADLCKAFEKNNVYDLIFLDIEMRNVGGIQAGTKIRDEYNNPLLPIVYISGKTDYALELFKIHPLDFLIKPLDEERIRRVMNRFLKITNFWSDVFTYEIGRDSFKVKLKDIKYFESVNRKVILHLQNKEEEFYGTLEKIYTERLSKHENFMFIHKSYIVNYDYVQMFEYERLFLHDKTELPIAQSKRKEIRTQKKTLDKR